MKSDSKPRFFISHFLFMLSLISVYRIPLIYPLVQDSFLPPMNRYVRFYIIAVLSLVFLFYYACLYYYNRDNTPLFKSTKASFYFWISTAVIFLLLCSSRALLSHDLYEYSLRARMLSIYGMNPFLHIPSEIKNDVFFPFLFWKNTPECYGPLWVIIGLLHSVLFRNSFVLSVYMHKFVLLIFLFLSARVFYKLCLELKLKNAGVLTLAFLMNPLVIIMTIVDGHNEIAMVFFMLYAFYFLIRSKYIRAFLFLTLAVNIKFVYLLILPLFIIYVLLVREGRDLSESIYRLFLAFILSLAVTFILWFPFGWGSVIAIFKYYNELAHLYWDDSIPFVFHFIFNRAGIEVSREALANIFSFIFLVIYAYAGYYFIRIVKANRQALFSFTSFIILALLFTNSTPFQPWYILWVLPFILLSSIRSKFLLTLLLSYFLIMTFWKRMSVLAIPMIFIYFVLLKIYNPESKRMRFLFSLETNEQR